VTSKTLPLWNHALTPLGAPSAFLKTQKKKKKKEKERKRTPIFLSVRTVLKADF
jgi:hypothetical protein